MTSSGNRAHGTPANDAEPVGSRSRRPMIEADSLSKFYGDFAACRDVTFTINRGEVVAFLGPNGAGKSTTMKLLDRLPGAVGRHGPDRRVQHGDRSAGRREAAWATCRRTARCIPT